ALHLLEKGDHLAVLIDSARQGDHLAVLIDSARQGGRGCICSRKVITEHGEVIALLQQGRARIKQLERRVQELLDENRHIFVALKDTEHAVGMHESRVDEQTKRAEERAEEV
ncbi:hypothetical protein T484DRAFT_1867755, partial [Baffinella frigidus]